MHPDRPDNWPTPGRRRSLTRAGDRATARTPEQTSPVAPARFSFSRLLTEVSARARCCRSFRQTLRQTGGIEVEGTRERRRPLVVVPLRLRPSMRRHQPLLALRSHPILWLPAPRSSKNADQGSHRPTLRPPRGARVGRAGQRRAASIPRSVSPARARQAVRARIHGASRASSERPHDELPTPRQGMAHQGPGQDSPPHFPARGRATR